MRKKGTLLEGLKRKRNTGICVLADVFCVLWDGTKKDNTAHAQKCYDVITKKSINRTTFPKGGREGEDQSNINRSKKCFCPETRHSYKPSKWLQIQKCSAILSSSILGNKHQVLWWWTVDENFLQHSYWIIVTYLGCIFDEILSGESMAIHVINKINYKLKFLYRQNKFLNFPLRRLLCNAPTFLWLCM